MQMTQEQFDAAIDSRVEEKMKSRVAEQKSALRAEFQEAYEAAHQEAQRKGYREEAPTIKLAKLVNLYGQANGDVERMKSLAGKMYSEDKEIGGYIGKALEAGVPSAGGFGIPQVLSARVIEALYAQTFLDKVGVARIPMPNGNVRLSRMDTSATVGWVGELPSASVTAPVFGEVALSAKKLFAIAEISNSLIRYNAVGIEGWLARDLQKKFRLALDYAALYGSGTAYSPAGLASLGVQTAGGTTTALDQLKPDEMIALLKAANVPMTRVAWVMHPNMEAWLKNLKTTTGAWIFRQEMIENGTLAGYPYHVTTQSSYTDTTTDYADLWVGDWDEFLWGAGLDLELRMSQDAAFVASGTTYSAFQRDSALVRVVGEHDFNVMHPVSFVKGTFSVA